MTKRRMIVGIIIIVIAVVFGAAFYYLNGALPIGTGYTAKYLCSQVFLAKRDAKTVFQYDVKPTNPLFALVDFQVDKDKRTVTASCFGSWKAIEAVYREGFGCTLAIDTSREELMSEVKGALLQSAPDTTRFWPDGERVDSSDPPDGLDIQKLNNVIQESFTEPDPDNLRNTQAVVISYEGKIVAERYKPPFTSQTPMLGWSMSKSVTNALVGILVKQGKIDIKAPAVVDEWRNAKGEKSRITPDELMRMSSGLAFDERYLPFADATEMLYHTKNMAQYAASRPMEAEPDTQWNYSSGSANIVAWLVKEAVGGTLVKFNDFAIKELFAPIAAHSAIIEPDASGSFVGSSYMFASPRDWARIGLLYLNDGVWNGKRLLPEGWVTYATTPTPKAPLGQYGAMIWLNRGDPDNPENRTFPTLPTDLFYFSGYNEQIVAVIPSKRLVIVRLGVTPKIEAWDKEGFLRNVIACVHDG